MVACVSLGNGYIILLHLVSVCSVGEYFLRQNDILFYYLKKSIDY